MRLHSLLLVSSNQVNQILVETLLLPVGQLDEQHVYRVLAILLDLDPQPLEPAEEAMAARVAPQPDLLGRLPDVGSAHDLVRIAPLEHAVLMDAGLVREGVAPDDGLVGRHWKTGCERYHPARLGEMPGFDGRVRPELIGANAQRHHDLLE